MSEDIKKKQEESEGFIPKPDQNAPKKKKIRKDSGITDFLKSISSTATLPPYVKGENFSSRRGVINQCILTLGVLLLTSGAGQPIGLSAVLLPQLFKENSTMKIDMEMGSWIASIHSAATPIGSFASGPLMEYMGRKRLLQMLVFPMMAGWIIIATSTSHTAILIGRVVAGLGVGSVGAPSQVYLAEISEPRLRGMLSGFPFVAYSLGILLIYAFGSLMHWRIASWLGTVLPLLSLCVLSFSPESPTWLARKRRLREAKDALARLRGDEVIAERELHQMVSALEKDKKEVENESSVFWATMKQASVLKPLLIILTFNILQILAGTFMIVFYAVDIISGAAGGEISGQFAANFTALARFACTIITCFLLFYVGKRKIVTVSGLGSSIAIIALGVYVWKTLDEPKTSVNMYVTCVCLLLYVMFNTVGFFVMPGMLIGELLPAKARGLCGGYIFMAMNLTVFGTTKLFPSIRSLLGIHGMFLSFGLSTLVATLFMFVFMPETNGKSLLEIEQYFKQSNLTWLFRNKAAESTNNKISNTSPIV